MNENIWALIVSVERFFPTDLISLIDVRLCRLFLLHRVFILCLFRCWSISYWILDIELFLYLIILGQLVFLLSLARVLSVVLILSMNSLLASSVFPVFVCFFHSVSLVSALLFMIREKEFGANLHVLIMACWYVGVTCGPPTLKATAICLLCVIWESDESPRCPQEHTQGHTQFHT